MVSDLTASIANTIVILIIAHLVGLLKRLNLGDDLRLDQGLTFL